MEAGTGQPVSDGPFLLRPVKWTLPSQCVSSGPKSRPLPGNSGANCGQFGQEQGMPKSPRRLGVRGVIVKIMPRISLRRQAELRNGAVEREN
jgi:hypothetical protein